jgi:hypothetical protein
MYFQRNREFGSALSKLRNFEPPQTPLQYATDTKGSHLLIMPLYCWAYAAQACQDAWSKLSAGTASNQGYLLHVFFLFWRHSPPIGQILLFHEVSRSHTTTHCSRWYSSGRMISSPERPLSDNTQHSHQSYMPPVGFEPTVSAGEWP